MASISEPFIRRPVGTTLLAIGLPYFVGHGLAVHSAAWVVAGVVSGILAAVLIFVALRLSPSAERRGPHV